MDWHTRKSPRIPGYDYSTQNYYFITVCCHNRKCIFGTVDQLNRIGIIAENQIRQIPLHYEKVAVEKFVVMPNHVHMILALNCNGKYDVGQIIGQYKSGVSREVRKFCPDREIWQRSFHDHIIRSQAAFEKIWMYIEGNPQCWKDDCFFTDGCTL